MPHKKNNKIKNKIKNNKQQRTQENRTLSKPMEGPEGQYVLEEEEYVHVHSGLEDLHDHLEPQQSIVEMDMRIESLEFDMEMEQSAHDELDEILERGLEQEEMKNGMVSFGKE